MNGHDRAPRAGHVAAGEKGRSPACGDRGLPAKPRDQHGRPAKKQQDARGHRQRRRSPPPSLPSPSLPSPSLPSPSLPPTPSPPTPRSPTPPTDSEDRRPRIVELSDKALAETLATDGYQLGSTIGHGSYSKVRVALHAFPGRATVRVACKVINKLRKDDGSYVDKFLPREMEVLGSIRHPNVVRTHRIYVSPSHVHVFMDYCENGDLLNHLQRTKGIPLWQAQTFFKQIGDAVEYLHRIDISHRDIKCENVLLENMRHVKLTDFGFSKMCTNQRGRRLLSQTFCGSSSYAAPEILLGIPYDPKAYDVWALGVVLYLMLADVMPYPYNNWRQIVANQMARKFAKPKRFISQDAIRLITMILEPDVARRATMIQIKNHQWVKQNTDFYAAMR